jgi:hypothetical protein
MVAGVDIPWRKTRASMAAMGGRTEETEGTTNMRDLQRLFYDFERLAFHYDIATLYGQFFVRVLPIIGLTCIALGLMASGSALSDTSGNPRRAVRRIALAGAYSLLGVALYVLIPLGLDALGITPTPTHVRFYGMFFLPVGAFAGVLAVVVSSTSWFAHLEGESKQRPFSRVGYGIGFAVLWIVFLLYSRLMLGATMIIAFGLIRATASAAIGALLFAYAPYLICAIERRPASGRLLPWGYGLLIAGAISLLVAQVVTQVLSLNVNII